jgi:hypothetical protein
MSQYYRKAKHKTIETVKREINEESTSAVLSTAVSFTNQWLFLCNLLLFKSISIVDVLSSMVFL